MNTTTETIQEWTGNIGSADPDSHGTFDVDGYPLGWDPDLRTPAEKAADQYEADHPWIEDSYTITLSDGTSQYMIRPDNLDWTLNLLAERGETTVATEFVPAHRL